MSKLKQMIGAYWGKAVLGLGVLCFVWPAILVTLGTMNDLSQHMELLWVIPLLSLLLLYLKRKEVYRAGKAPRPRPILASVLLIIAGLFFFLGLRGGQDRFLQVAGILALLAWPLGCYGWRMMRLTAMPILILFFVMPLGFLDNFTVPLRRFSVTVTVAILNGCGIAVQQVGTAIVARSQPFFQLDVADPCSGIRSILALFAGTAAYGFWAFPQIWKRWVLFFLSVPIALVGNVFRLLLTGVVCHLAGQSSGMLLHDNALFIIAPFYIGVIFWSADKLKNIGKPVVVVEKDPVHEAPTPISLWSQGGLCLLGALSVFFVIWAKRMPALVFESDDYLRGQLVAVPGMTIQYPLYCQNRECLWSDFFEPNAVQPTVCPKCGGELSAVSKAELDILPADTQCYKAQYVVQSATGSLHQGDRFTVSLVIAGRSRFSIHRPELCLPSQGYTLSERHTEEALPKFPMALISLRMQGQVTSHGFAYTFVHSKGVTVSNLERVLGDAWERSVNNRIPRWAMVTISSNRDFLLPENQAVLGDFLRCWEPTLWSTKGGQLHD